jgi:hypothetical protein
LKEDDADTEVEAGADTEEADGDEDEDKESDDDSEAEGRVGRDWEGEADWASRRNCWTSRQKLRDSSQSLACRKRRKSSRSSPLARMVSRWRDGGRERERDRKDSTASGEWWTLAE